MRKLALALALFVPWGCRSAAPTPPVTPQPPPTTAHEIWLPFLELPLGLEDTTGWESAETESFFTYDGVARGLGAGDIVVLWLAGHGICDPAVPKCSFLAHVQVLQKPGDAEGNQAIIARYTFRGAGGRAAEGCVFLKTVNGVHEIHSWERRNTFWVYHDTEEERAAELLFVMHLTHLIDQLSAADQLDIF